MTRRQSFTVGDWLVEPDLGRISGDAGDIALRRQVMDLLVYLADRPDAVVSTDDLLGSLWAGKYVTEGTLYNCVRELREALGDDRTYVETLPRRGYRLVAPVGSAESSPGADHSRRGALAAVFAALAAAALVFFWPSRTTDEAPAALDKSIAVLPFADLSPQRENEYLGHGISEALIHQLAQVPDLHVVARTSSFSFAGAERDIREIGEALNVGAILEGSVQKEGETLRIIAQLIDVRSGNHVWSRKFDRSTDSLFRIQDEIGLAVAGYVSGAQLEDGTLSYSVVPAPDPAAYDLYMQGQYHLNTLFAPGQANTNMDAPADALEFFRRATDVDPGFALAWAAQARALNMLMLMERKSADEAIPLIQDHIGRAIQLGGQLAEVQFAAGELTRGEDALSHLDRAVEINPNFAQAQVVRASLLLELGRYRESFDAIDAAASLDPLNGAAVEGALYASFYRGRWDNIEERIVASNRLWPDANGLATEAHLMMELGRFARLPDLERRARVVPGFGVTDWYASAPRHFGDAYLTLGVKDAATAWLSAPGMVAAYDDVVLLYDGDFAGAEQFLMAQIETSRNRPPYAFRSYPDIVASLVETYLYERRYDELVTFFGSLGWPPGLPPLPGCCQTNPPWPEVAYTFAMFETGQNEEANQWLEHVAAGLEHRLDQGVQVPNHYYELARLRVMQGRVDEALNALDTAVRLGWRRWYFDRDPILDPVRALPAFAELEATYLADIDKLRGQVIAGLAKPR